MKKSMVTGLVLIGMATVPAAAAEVGLILDKQIGKAQAFGAAVAGSVTPGSYDAVSPTGVGIRLGYSFLDLKVAEIGMALTYHPKAEADLKVPAGVVGKYSNEYVALGVQADWKFLVNLHAGLDLRSEKLVTTMNSVTESSTYTRPWVKAGIGFSVPTPIVSPFVRLEVAMPLAKDDKLKDGNDFRKAMAPSLQVSLYGGIRF